MNFFFISHWPVLIFSVKIAGKSGFIGFVVHAVTPDGSSVGKFLEPLPDGVQFLNNCTTLKVSAKALMAASNCPGLPHL